MKFNPNTVLLFLFLSIFVIGAGQIPARHYSPDLVRLGYFLFDHDLYGARFVLKHKEEIQLSGPQEKKIENLLISFEEYLVIEQAEIKVMELKLALAMKSETIDRKLIAGSIREISARKTDFSVKYLNYLLDIKAMLTSGQMDKLKEIRKQISTRRPRSSEVGIGQNTPLDLI